jgi:hypothetical protein
MNRELGLETRLDYKFSATGDARAALLDTVVGDFDGDSRDDLAIGFDRTLDGFSQIELGAVLFSDIANVTDKSGPVSLGRTTFAPGQENMGSLRQLGYLTALDAGKSLFGAVDDLQRSVRGWLYTGAESRQVAVGAAWPSDLTFVRGVTVGGAERVLAGLMDSVLIFDPRDKDWRPSMLAMAFPHHRDHELGGGPRSPNYYLLDMDGDGDLELVEYDRDYGSATLPTPKLAIHAGSSSTGPAAAYQMLALPGFWDPFSETPFLAVGGMKGRLLVSAANASDPAATMNVVALGCK